MDVGEVHIYSETVCVILNIIVSFYFPRIKSIASFRFSKNL